MTFTNKYTSSESFTEPPNFSTLVPVKMSCEQVLMTLSGTVRDLLCVSAAYMGVYYIERVSALYY